MNGYEKYSRDYGGPPPGWGDRVLTVILLLLAIAIVGYAVWRSFGA